MIIPVKYWNRSGLIVLMWNENRETLESFCTQHVIFIQLAWAQKLRSYYWLVQIKKYLKKLIYLQCPLMCVLCRNVIVLLDQSKFARQVIAWKCYAISYKASQLCSDQDISIKIGKLYSTIIKNSYPIQLLIKWDLNYLLMSSQLLDL